MPHHQGTVAGELLPHLLFRQDQGMAGLLEKVLNQVPKVQVTAQLKAAPDARTAERQG